MSESELHPLIYNFLVSSKLKKTAKAFVKELSKSSDEFESALKLDKYKSNLVTIYQSHKKAAPVAPAACAVVWRCGEHLWARPRRW